MDIRKGFKKKGKTCETNKPNNIKDLNQGFWVSTCICSQRPAYVGFNLHVHAHNMCAWDLFKNPNPETQSKKQSMNKKH